MTDKEIIERLKSLGWAMYHSAFNITSDASKLKSAMQNWYDFINFGMNTVMINIIGIDEKDANLIKEALKRLDIEFESQENTDGKDLSEQRSRIEKIVREINIKFNL